MPPSRLAIAFPDLPRRLTQHASIFSAPLKAPAEFFAIRIPSPLDFAALYRLRAPVQETARGVAQARQILCHLFARRPVGSA